MAVSEKNIDMYNISELAGLVSTAIKEINNTGAVVLNLTCDNPSSNWSMLELLRLHLKSTKVSLDLKNILDIPIFSTPDVCHLVKLVRNCWGLY